MREEQRIAGIQLFRREVLSLHEHVGKPASSMYEKYGLPTSSAHELLRGTRGKPRRETVKKFVAACTEIAKERKIPVVEDRFGPKLWDDRYDILVAGVRRPPAAEQRAGDAAESPPSRPPPTPHADRERAFRHAYAASVADALDEVVLHGFTGRNTGRAALLTAYTGLHVTPENEPHRTGPGPVLRVDTALRERRRVLVRGRAGAGKSTLLRRLAVTAARSAFTGELTGWNGLVPVLVELRNHPDGRLPAPEELLHAAAVPSAAAGMPGGWLDRRLHEGTVLLLTDGADELDSEAQQRVRDWLGALLDAYPDNRAVVTSRSAVLSGDWLGAQGFGSVLLEPLTLDSIADFVERWHRASSAPDRNGPRRHPGTHRSADADRFREDVLTALRTRPQLAELATNPLLASLICAVWWEHGRLPAHRAETFKLALELLVEQRGMDQRVPRARVPFAASRDTVLDLLRGLALLLSERGRTEITREQLREYAAGELAARPEVSGATADEVLGYLVARSGILRTSPQDGTVGFVHRSFQEYLTAVALSDEERMDVLVARAHLPLWHDTVVMAACAAPPRQLPALLGGIVDRAEAEQHHRRSLQRLAVSCLETTRRVPDGLRERLGATVSAVLPPRRRAECHALAAVRDWTLDALPHTLGDLTGDLAPLTVLTAALCGGDRGLELLAGYAEECVQDAGRLRAARREVEHAWRHFAPGAYAERVLNVLPLDAAGRPAAVDLWITRQDQWEAAVRLLARRAAGLHLALPCGRPVLDGLPRFTRLRRLRIDALPEGGDLAPLADCRELRELKLAGDGPLPDLRPVTSLPRLDYLALWNWPPFSLDTTPLPATLTSLGLMGLPLGATLEWLADLDGLTALALAGVGKPAWLDALTALHRLTELDLGGYDLTGHLPSVVEAVPGLKDLGLRSCTAPTDLAPLRRADRLASLDLRDVRGRDGAPLDFAVFRDRPAGLRKLQVRADGRTLIDADTVPWDRVRIKWQP